MRLSHEISDVSASIFFDSVWFTFLFSDQVGPSVNLENFPKNPNFVNFFPSGQKISSDRVKGYLGERQTGPLFSYGQKYAWVRLGEILLEICQFKTHKYMFEPRVIFKD